MAQSRTSGGQNEFLMREDMAHPKEYPTSETGSIDGEGESSSAGEFRSAVDRGRIERAVREILAAVGEDPDREGLRDTPARVARMYAELFAGLHEDPRSHLERVFTEKYDEIVLVRDITFNSMCEHHLLPFMGRAHVGYIPRGKVLGLSKLVRVVEGVSRRPQVQERMTEEIANLLQSELEPKGVAVVVEATHTCMTVRGVRKPGSLCVTSAMKGLFRTNVSSRAEVMQLIYGERR
jgi:GTP cyclohydrolase I